MDEFRKGNLKQLRRLLSAVVPTDLVTLLAVLAVLVTISLALVGWVLNIPSLKGVSPQWTAMRIITIICFFMSAAVMTIVQRRSTIRWTIILSRVFAAAIIVVSLLTLVSYIVELKTGQEWPWALSPLLSPFLTSATRMAVITAILFSIYGCVLLLLAAGSRRAADVAHAMLFPVATMAYLILVGYLFNVRPLYEWLHLGVALNTGIAFCALCIASFFARPDTWLMNVFIGDKAGAIMARRLLPASLTLPLLIGWLRVQGERFGAFSSEVGVALVAVVYTVCFLSLVWMTAKSVNRTDQRRRDAEETLRESEAKYRNLFENMAEEVHLWKLVRDETGQIKTWRVVDVNPPTLKTWGRNFREDTIGRLADEIYAGATEHYMPVVQKIMREGVPYSFEDYFPPPVDKHFRFTSVPLGEYFITTGADITGIKKAEEVLREAKELLEEKVRERTMDLQNLTKQLEQNRHELRRLASELVLTEQRERKRVAEVLHDDIAQLLAAARMRLDLLQSMPSDQKDKQTLMETKAFILQCIKETRALMNELGNPVLFDLGLKSACEALAERLMETNPVRITCDIRDTYKNLNPDMKILLYQVVRELLNNIVKHSQAITAHVLISMENEHFRVKVADDGVGFSTQTLGVPSIDGGFGLYSIRERLMALDGSLRIESSPGAGTVVTAILPEALD